MPGASSRGCTAAAEALLLQAAQTLGADSFVPARRDGLPTTIQELITQAEGCLQAAMTRWRDLRDPEVQESNFVHPVTGEEYNYRAEETYKVLTDLQGGGLTRYFEKLPINNFKPGHSQLCRVLLNTYASDPMTTTQPGSPTTDIADQLQPRQLTNTSRTSSRIC
jgi:hypothetical protein